MAAVRPEVELYDRHPWSAWGMKAGGMNFDWDRTGPKGGHRGIGVKPEGIKVCPAPAVGKHGERRQRAEKPRKRATISIGRFRAAGLVSGQETGGTSPGTA